MPNSDQIQLNSGRTINLRSLRQWQIYAGLLEGLPTVEMNRRKIECLINEERERTEVEPHVIRPVEKPLKYIGDKQYPFGEPAALPGIGCVAYFTSIEPAKNLSLDYSALVMIWFQEHYAFPIDSTVLTAIQALDWERLATDVEY